MKMNMMADDFLKILFPGLWLFLSGMGFGEGDLFWCAIYMIMFCITWRLNH